MFGALAALVASVSLAHVQTLAVVPVNVTDFAQSHRYVAWTTERSVVMDDLRTDKRTMVAHDSKSSPDEVTGQDLVVAGDRAFWTVSSGSLSTRFELLMSSAIDDTKVRRLDFEAVYAGGDQKLLAPVSDGRDAYFWEAYDGDGNFQGPLVRYRGRKGRALTAHFGDFYALGAGDGRYAFARILGDCVCAETPAWSPDGSQIAYQGWPDQIWVINADGTGRHSLGIAGAEPDWSPDGKSIAFARNKGGIVIATRDGANEHVVTETGRNPAWSPDGRRLAFDRQSTIWTANADGTDARAVATGKDPDWSPDGKQLVFNTSRSGGLAIANADGTNVRVWSGVGWDPAWSPDGRYIAFRGLDEAAAVFVGNVSGSIIYGGSERVDGELLYAGHPSWSPDSTHIVYSGDLEFTANGGPNLFVTELGGESIQLTSASSLATTPLAFHAPSGRTLVNVMPSGTLVDIAVSRAVCAALTEGKSGDLRVEVYKPLRRIVTLRGGVSDFQAAGSTIVFRSGRSIYTLVARHGPPRLIARAAARPVGLSIIGRRIAWAENRGRHAVIRAVLLPT